MGRTLEALKQPQRQPGGLERERPSLRAAPVGEPDLEPAEGQEEVPFIEVGPHRTMDGSPSVLASAPPGPVLGPRLAVPETEEQAGTVDEEAPIPRKLHSVAFRPAPALPAPREEARQRFPPELVAYHNPEHAVSVQYVRLLGPLLAVAPEARSQVLLFTSVRPGGGTTTVLLNVAITAARQGRRRVVVVDGNLRRPALAERLGIGPGAGLRDVLVGTVPLEKSLCETDQANLFALTAGSTPSARGVRFVAETVRSLLRQLRHRFDLVLVDGPRWDGQPDVVLLGSACDSVYLVVPEAEADSPQVDDLYQLIPQQGARLGGCILAGD
jgi:Mrp family chromosome partitioning ATPase